MRLSAAEKIVIANVANVTNVPPSLPSPSADLHANQAPFNPWPVPQTATVRAKLPKLKVWKFEGNISEWQEFWDSFESAIDRNETLAEIDKFSYLQGLLIEQARSAIAGFSLTSANYKAAIQLLKKHYSKQNVIHRTYINDLLNFELIYGERDTQRLRTMYDFAETKYRALEALGVDQETYSAIVVPSLLKKLPEQLRLTITWGEDHHEWNLEQLLDVLGHKVELREDYNRSARSARHVRSPCDESMKKKHTMNTRKQASYQNCPFCLGGHKHEDCQKVKKISEHKQLLIKFGHCFSCIWKGHLPRDCRANLTCKFCKGKHHSSICSAESPGEGEASESEPSKVESVGNNMHIETGNSVALQTSQGQVAGKCNARIRVAFCYHQSHFFCYGARGANV